MTNVHYQHRHLTVACDLQAAEMGRRVAEWRRLRDCAGLGVDAIPGGARLRLRPAAWDDADELARREANCCGFLDFDLASEGDRVRLDVTSEVPEAQQVIACLVGLEPDCILRCC